MGVKNHEALIQAIATRAGTVRELAERFGMTTDQVRQFAETNLAAIEQANKQYEEKLREDGLWITSKSERLSRYQRVVDDLIDKLDNGEEYDALNLREIRTYMRYAAEELGQLMHRNSGQSDDDAFLNYSVAGVDLEQLK